jgi:hypothetical protein
MKKFCAALIIAIVFFAGCEFHVQPDPWTGPVPVHTVYYDACYPKYLPVDYDYCTEYDYNGCVCIAYIDEWDWECRMEYCFYYDSCEWEFYDAYCIY